MSGQDNADAVVIGAGIIGCAVALELGRAGWRVVVVDKGAAVGGESTSSSSAIVRFNYSTLDGVITAWESKHLWDRWSDHVGGDQEPGLARFHQIGALAIEPPGTDRAERVLSLFDAVGVPYEVLGPEQLVRRWPAMDPGRFWPPRRVDDDRFWDGAHGRIDAVFTPDAGFVDDPQLAARNLMVAAERERATFRLRTAVTGIVSRGGRVAGIELDDGTAVSAPVIVNAAGPWSSRVNAMAGVLDEFATITTRALRQEVHALPAPPGSELTDGGVVVLDADLGTYFRPQPGGTILVGGVEPECDPLIWIDDADRFDATPTVEVWQAQSYRAARRLPGLTVPSRPRGLAALYDVTPDWVPVYDRTSLPGLYVAIGTSGNQFKNAPMVGRFMATLIEACENGHDHDRNPIRVDCPITGHEVDLGHYSRLRTLAGTSNNVLG